MSRREFLHLVSGAAVSGLLGGCVPRVTAARATAPSATPTKLRAVCFDLFTLFDPRTVVDAARAVVPDGAAELCEAWRARQFQYAFLHAASRQYVDFRQITDDALVFAARARGLSLSAAERARLVRAYSELEPWPDTHATLAALRRSGLRLAMLTNYSPEMIEQLLVHTGLTALFDAQISTDAAKTFKPDPRAYALGPATLGVQREEIAFSAFGGWDAAGAKWFGYPTFWVNRLGVPEEELGAPPDGTGPTLVELAAFVTAWGA